MFQLQITLFVVLQSDCKYKWLQKKGHAFMRDLLKLRLTTRPVREKYKMIIPELNQVSYGKKSLIIFGLKTLEQGLSLN